MDVAEVAQPTPHVRLMELIREYEAHRQQLLDACDDVLPDAFVGRRAKPHSKANWPPTWA